MPQIPIQLPKEITDKYSIVSNAFRLAKIKNPELDKYNNAPKDLIVSEVGDVKQQEFYPQIKLGRWGNTENDNEVNFSIRLKDTEYEKAQVSTLKDKIIWDKGNTKIEFYDYPENEGGMKMVWYLKSKPATNKVEFTIQSKGLNFYYQPPLTQEYQNGYSEEFQKDIVVSETQVKDLDGNVLVERPENVVGSYAVCHQTKGGMNDINGKEYKVGKVGHIYRPKIIDAVGKETWGILHIENGIYSVEIPQNFLDKAVYPLKSNDTFGYTTAGSSYDWVSANTMIGSEYTAPANIGITTSLTFSTYEDKSGAVLAKGVLVLHSDSTLVTNGIGNGATLPTSKNWATSSFSTSPSLTADEIYVLTLIPDSGSQNVAFYHDSITGASKHTNTANNYITPINPTFAHSAGVKKSIYATYTPAGGGPAGVKSVNGVALASIKSINVVAIADVKSVNGIT